MNLPLLPDVPIDPTWLVAGAVIALWIVWAVARKIVGIGFFLIYLAISMALCWVVLGAFAAEPPKPWVLVPSAFAIAWTWSVLRNKIARVVSSIALLLLLRTAPILVPALGELGLPLPPNLAQPGNSEEKELETETIKKPQRNLQENTSKPKNL